MNRMLRDVEMREALEQIVALSEKAALSGKRARTLHDIGEIAQAAINTADRRKRESSATDDEEQHDGGR